MIYAIVEAGGVLAFVLILGLIVVVSVGGLAAVGALFRWITRQRP